MTRQSATNFIAVNGASNAAAGGRARSAEQRSLLRYLRGKLDDVVEDGQTVDKLLRGRGGPTCGAIATTFVADTGDRCTAMRGDFAPASATKDDLHAPRLPVPGGLRETRASKGKVTRFVRAME